MSFLFVLTLIFVPYVAFASPAEEIPEKNISFLDTIQEFLGTRTNFAANRLDSFFATDRADDEFGRTRIRIRSQYTIRERALGLQRNQYRINLKLPHLEDKFHYQFFQDKNKKNDKDKSKSSSSEAPQIKDTDLLGKLRHGWIFNSDIGVSAAIPPSLTTRGRLRNNFQTGTLIHRFVEQLTYVTGKNGLENEVNLQSDHAYDENHLFRFVNRWVWQVLKKTYTTQHGPTFLQRVSDDDAFSYSFIGSFVHTNHTSYFNGYFASIDYRRNLYRQWLYLDIAPGLDFPKGWSFRRNPYIFFQIEMLFGGT